MDAKQYDTVRLKDGRIGLVLEVFEGKGYIVETGTSSEDWDTVPVAIDEVEEVIPDSNTTP